VLAIGLALGFRVTVRVSVRVSVSVRGGLRLGLGFIFYAYFVSAKPVAAAILVAK